MSMPSRYHADPWGHEFGELDVPSWVKPFVQAAVRARPKRLWEVIPDDPNYQKYIPINYRLDATRLVGLAQDLQRGKSAHIWVELTEWGRSRSPNARQSHRGPQSQWRPRDWSEWYGEAAVAFRRNHLTA